MITKEKIQNGDILVCSSNGWLGRQIKRFTRSDVNHVAMAIKVGGVLMVIDSQKDGTNPKTYENWLKKYGYDFKVFRYTWANPQWGKSIREKALSKSGVTGYDFIALLWHQPRYLLTGKWKGKKGDDAARRMYCSEFVAWCHSLPNWWEMSPADVLRFCQNSENYIHIK